MSEGKRGPGLPTIVPLQGLEIAEGPASSVDAPTEVPQEAPTETLARPAWSRAPAGPVLPLHVHGDFAPAAPVAPTPPAPAPAVAPAPTSVGRAAPAVPPAGSQTAPAAPQTAPIARGVPAPPSVSPPREEPMGLWSRPNRPGKSPSWKIEAELEPAAAPSAGVASAPLAAPSPLSVAMLGPPGVGKTYFCKGLVQLFLRPDRLGLHVENLTAVVRRGGGTLPLESYLERFKAGSRESPTAPAHGLNLHDLVIDWGRRDTRGRQAAAGRASILLNDTAGEILRNLNENQELQRYVCQAETIWMLLPAWVLARSEGEVRGQPRSFRRAVRDFTDEVDWMYDHAQKLQGKRRFVMVWTMGNDPAVRAWAREVQLYDDWLRAGEAMRDRKLFALARFVSFQRQLNVFLDAYLRAVPELDLLQHGVARLRKLGGLRHSLINVIDDLELEGGAGREEVRENLLHVEAPVLSLLSKTLAFGV